MLNTIPRVCAEQAGILLLETTRGEPPVEKEHDEAPENPGGEIGNLAKQVLVELRCDVRRENPARETICYVASDRGGVKALQVESVESGMK